MKSFSLHACLAILLSITACHVSVTHGFAPVTSPSLTASSSRTAFTNSRTQTTKTATTTTTLLKMVDNEKEEFMKFARQSRSAGSNDRVVELVRPLGIVLADDGQGNVYVQTVAPRGNAARTGMVSVIQHNIDSIILYITGQMLSCSILHTRIQQTHLNPVSPLSLSSLYNVKHFHEMKHNIFIRSKRVTLLPCAAPPLAMKCGRPVGWASLVSWRRFASEPDRLSSWPWKVPARGSARQPSPPNKSRRPTRHAWQPRPRKIDSCRNWREMNRN